jgi:hypothetical protein
LPGPPGRCGVSAFGQLPDVIWRTPAPNNGRFQ